MADEMARGEHDDFHKEFAKRIDAENSRQNKRLDLLEKNVNQINDLTISVEKMAVNVENMLEELKKQRERLETLENEPVENFNQIKATIITALVSTVVGSAATAIIMIF